MNRFVRLSRVPLTFGVCGPAHQLSPGAVVEVERRDGRTRMVRLGAVLPLEHGLAVASIAELLPKAESASA